MGTYITGYGKIETELLGIVKRKQMYLPNSEEWLIKRISPICENCNGNEHYNINTSFRKLVVLIPLGKMDQVYRIICPKCGETIELEIEEYMLIQPFIELNNLEETGKIDEFEYNVRLEKIEARLLKIKRD